MMIPPRLCAKPSFGEFVLIGVKGKTPSLPVVRFLPSGRRCVNGVVGLWI